tara:strand:+ start:546 stop:788 length:243 start_codon:yes stop_codon:yes gene_type:complete
MADLTKLTKAQLISVIEESEENKYDNFKEAFGMTYTTDDEWIDFFKKVQENSLSETSLDEKIKEALKADNLRRRDLPSFS